MRWGSIEGGGFFGLEGDDDDDDDDNDKEVMI
jgi:hypothetical protein